LAIKLPDHEQTRTYPNGGGSGESMSYICRTF
jgi:hypothetical protein